MSYLKKYDLRQLLLAISTIELFECKKITLYELIIRLSGILDAIESISDNWKNEFREELNNLEVIFDSIEDGSISRWKDDFNERKKKSIEKLKKITNNIIDEYLNHSDANVLETAEMVNHNWFVCPKCNEAWQSNSLQAMVICLNCKNPLHNPRMQTMQP